MTTPDGLLAEARRWLGDMETPRGSNHCRTTDRFADLSGWEWARRGNPWCVMAVSVWLTDAGLPTTYAYTPTYVAAFKAGSVGLWVGGPQAQCEPGDVVAFSFRKVRPDHVGVVERVNGDGTITTIEGNVADAVRRQHRGRGSIVGFGRPAYTAAADPPPDTPPAHPPYPGRLVRRGQSGPNVRVVQQRLRDRGWRIAVDGVFGPGTERVVRAFQADSIAHRWPLALDGIVGPETWRALWARPIS